MLKGQRASVWYIDRNDLEHSNKNIVKLNYKNFEIAVLKEQLKYEYQEFLVKDKNNEYWALGIAPIKFKNFKKVIENPFAEERTYCDDILNKYNDKRSFINILKSNFIHDGLLFNASLKEYIYKYYPDIYKEKQRVTKIMDKLCKKKIQQNSVNKDVKIKKKEQER